MVGWLVGWLVGWVGGGGWGGGCVGVGVWVGVCGCGCVHFLSGNKTAGLQSHGKQIVTLEFAKQDLFRLITGRRGAGENVLEGEVRSEGTARLHFRL